VLSHGRGSIVGHSGRSQRRQGDLGPAPEADVAGQRRVHREVDPGHVQEGTGPLGALRDEGILAGHGVGSFGDEFDAWLLDGDSDATVEPLVCQREVAEPDVEPGPGLDADGHRRSFAPHRVVGFDPGNGSFVGVDGFTPARGLAAARGAETRRRNRYSSLPTCPRPVPHR